jgi:putative endopeptidase
MACCRARDLSKDRVKFLDAEKRAGSKAGDVYASYLDHATVEKMGLKPIQPWLKTVRSVKSKAAFEKLLPVAARNGVRALFGGYVGQDDKNPDVYIFQMYQAGTGLPDRDMYLVENDKFEGIRNAYKAYLAQMLTLAGEKSSRWKSASRSQWTRGFRGTQQRHITNVARPAGMPSRGLKMSSF